MLSCYTKHGTGSIKESYKAYYTKYGSLVLDHRTWKNTRIQVMKRFKYIKYSPI